MMVDIHDIGSPDGNAKAYCHTVLIVEYDLHQTIGNIPTQKKMPRQGPIGHLLHPKSVRIPDVPNKSLFMLFYFPR